MSNSKGMSLIETLVSVVIGAFIVLAVGGLSERLFHSRTTNSSNSAAMDLAERQMETLLAAAVQNPAAGCTSAAAMCGSTTSPGMQHGPTTVSVMQPNGQNDSYIVTYWVRDNSASPDSPLVTPTAMSGNNGNKVKQITVEVTHSNNPAVKAKLVRYVRVYS